MYLLHNGDYVSMDDVMRVLIAEKNISQLELGRRINIHPSNIKNFFQKRTNARMSFFGLTRMLAAIDCTCHDVERVIAEMRKNGNSAIKTNPGLQRPNNINSNGTI